jgi:hypothetical protein
MPPPLPRCSGWAHSSLKLAHPYQPSPKPLSGRPAHRPFRGLLGVHSRCGLHTRAVTKIATVIRRLQTFRHLHACPGCFRLERLPGGAYTHWKAPPCHGARGLRTFAGTCLGDKVAPKPAVRLSLGSNESNRPYLYGPAAVRFHRPRRRPTPQLACGVSAE